MQYVVAGVRTATKRVDVSGLPVLALGYSRGGPMAVEYGAVAPKSHLPVQNGIVSVFPADVGNQRHIVDLTPLPHSTRLLFMVGKEDKVVGAEGAKYLLYRLDKSGNPGTTVHIDVIRSRAGFVADHFAPLQDSPEARAAFWRPTDRLLNDLG
jgi:dienelactone hydrolase